MLRNTIFYKLYKRLRARLADMTYWSPSKWLKIIWVTWTDWKTTTVNLIHKIFNDNLWKTALVSTALIKIWENELDNLAKMTSFDPFELQKLLVDIKNAWCEYVILEVSSHGIDQYRFENIEFDAAVLTNITSEHLDYHKTMDNYAETKKRLFKWVLANSKPTKFAVLPKDNDYGRKWFDELPFDKSIDYGIYTNAWLKWDNIHESANWTEFDIKYLWKNYPLKTVLVWKYNVQNILWAVGIWLLYWIKIEDIVRSIEDFKWVVWRMEKLEHNWVNYYIDFAHTPNALESVLKFLWSIKWNWRIITLFWATWERDKYKRPHMWNVVDKLSDIMIITDDDPLNENRYDIISQIAKWVSRQEWTDYFIIPEREFAIKFLTEIVKHWDFVLLAGKWHEQMQITNFGKRPWSDKWVLKKYLGI